MNLLQRLKLRTKLVLVVGLAVLAVTASIGAGASLLQQRMVEDRVAKLDAVLDTTASLAKGLEAQVAAHRITHDQAIAQMREFIHQIRFGDGDYVTMQSQDGIVLAHATVPAMEGKVSANKDADGHSVFDLAMAAVAHTDRGIISYPFPRPGETVLKPKIASVVRFDPWKVILLCGTYVDDLEADYRSALLRLGGIGGGILTVTLLIAWLVNRDISHSLGALKLAMAKLATGDHSIEIPGTGRRDEVGDMAAAVLVFRHGLREVERLAGEQAGERQRADEEKHAALARMADTIESETRAAIELIGRRTEVIATAATDMSESASRTGISARGAADVSAQALSTAQTVASAAQQLASSIQEISGQVGRSTSVVGRAVARATPPAKRSRR